MNCEAIHCLDSGTVRFAIYPDGFDGPRIMARISDDALRELFAAGADNEKSLLDACETHFEAIEAKALERYRASPSIAVTLTTADFDTIIYIDEATCAS